MAQRIQKAPASEITGEFRNLSKPERIGISQSLER